MSCNCRNKTNNSEKINHSPRPEFKIVEFPPYTYVDLMQVKTALDSQTKEECERKVIADFNFRFFGEIINGYCDIACQNRTRTRVQQLWDKLETNNYESTKL